MRKIAIIVCVFMVSVLSLHGVNPQQGKRLPGYDGKFKDNAELTINNLLAKTNQELDLLRNEIFASYGRPFVNAIYQDYFQKQKWYSVNPKYSDALLTDTDRFNSELLLSLAQGDGKELQQKLLALGEISYYGNYYASHKEPDLTLVFSVDQVVVVSNDNHYFNSNAAVPYVIRGNWLIINLQKFAYYTFVCVQFTSKPKLSILSVHGEWENYK